MFWLKRILGNHFTLLCLFGKHGKFDQIEINFRVDRKITLTVCKTISDFILPENHLHLSHTLSSFSHEHSKLSEDWAPQSKTRQRRSPSDDQVRAPLPVHAPHASPCSSANPQSANPPTLSPIHPLFHSDNLTWPDLWSILYSIRSSHLTSDPTHPLQKPIHPLNLSIFLSLISDFFFFFFVMVVWVMVFWWFFCYVVMGFVWIVVDFLWVMVDFVI